MTELAYHLIQLWKEDIAEAWKAGTLLNAQTVLGRMAFAEEIQKRYQAWICPSLHFPPTEGVIFDQLEVFQAQRELHEQSVSLLLTEEEQIVCVLELSFSPDAYPNYREPLQRLSQLGKLAGKADLWLARDPLSGKLDRKQHFHLHPQLLCVYAILCRSAGLGLQFKQLKEEEAVSPIPSQFLHLTAALKSEKPLFGHHLVSE